MSSGAVRPEASPVEDHHSQFRTWAALVVSAGLLCVALAAAAQMPRVEVVAVKRGPLIEEVPVNGSVVALRDAELSMAVAGLIIRSVVDAGMRVERGDLLLELDAELAEYEQATAAAAAAEAASRLADARRQLEEARSVGAGLNIAASEVRRLEAAVTAAEAALSRQQATAGLAAARLRRHRLTAPFDGVISDRLVDEGEWVTPGSSVFRLVDPASLRLDFEVPQHFYGIEGGSTELRVGDAVGRVMRPATILEWMPVSSGSARTFTLQAVPPEGAHFAPGMAVSGLLRISRDQNALAVPRDAINRYPDGRITLWTVDAVPGGDGHRVRERRIRILGSSGDQVYVGSGLEGDERVVVLGNESLSDGLEVQVIEQDQR